MIGLAMVRLVPLLSLLLVHLPADARMSALCRRLRPTKSSGANQRALDAGPAIVKAQTGERVQFSATAHFYGPETPASVTGNGSGTIEAWVYNATPQGAKTLLAWSRRGGAVGINCSFGHGTGLWLGAVGHWGGADIGWEGNITFKEWT